VDHLYQFASKSVHSFYKYDVHKFGNRPNRRTKGQSKNMMPPVASLASWSYNINKKNNSD